MEDQNEWQKEKRSLEKKIKEMNKGQEIWDCEKTKSMSDWCFQKVMGGMNQVGKHKDVIRRTTT